MATKISPQNILFTDLGVLILLAVARLALHTLTNGQYGFHRDELATLDDARYLAWGYVAYPPVTPFIGIRFFSALSQCVAMVLAGLMTRELGGSRLAQIITALAVAIAPISLIQGALFQYVSLYTIVFFVAGLAGGMVFTKTRRHVSSPWLWGGAALSLLIFLPNLLWQAQQNFISLEFLSSIHARDISL